MDDNAITQASDVYNGGLNKQCIAGTNQFCQFFNSYTFLLLISANLSLKNFTNLKKMSVISIYK